MSAEQWVPGPWAPNEWRGDMASDPEAAKAGMHEHLVSFFVAGVPVPQGSKQAFVLKNSNPPRAILVEANKKLDPWRAEVSKAARAAYEGEPFDGPVRVSALFKFPRLKSHYKSDGETLRENAPLWKESTPDLDKLCRALGDAMTSIVLKDDARIAYWDARRVYSSTPGVTVKVYSL